MIKKRILIANGDLESLQFTQVLLSKEGYEVKVCKDGLEALKEIQTSHYQLILMDIFLPKLNGFEVLKRVSGSNDTPIIAISSRDDIFDKVYALEIGADDYLIQPVNNRELIARVKVVFRRFEITNNFNIKETLSINDVNLCNYSREVYCRGRSLNLTGREFEVLHCLLLHAGTVVSKQKIAQYIHGRSLGYDNRSIEMHIYNIRKKISLFFKHQKIKTIRGSGYIFLQETA